jgi:hypothetical protein
MSVTSARSDVRVSRTRVLKFEVNSQPFTQAFVRHKKDKQNSSTTGRWVRDQREESTERERESGVPHG